MPSSCLPALDNCLANLVPATIVATATGSFVPTLCGLCDVEFNQDGEGDLGSPFGSEGNRAERRSDARSGCQRASACGRSPTEHTRHRRSQSSRRRILLNSRRSHALVRAIWCSAVRACLGLRLYKPL